MSKTVFFLEGRLSLMMLPSHLISAYKSFKSKPVRDSHVDNEILRKVTIGS